MEYLKVKVLDETGTDIDVLINGEKNGKIEEVLTLSEGWVTISVNIKADKIELYDVTQGHPGKDINDGSIELCNTTPTKPMIIEAQING